MSNVTKMFKFGCRAKPMGSTVETFKVPTEAKTKSFSFSMNFKAVIIPSIDKLKIKFLRIKDEEEIDLIGIV